jgi:hypothetical protein
MASAYELSSKSLRRRAIGSGKGAMTQEDLSRTEKSL